MYSLKNTIIIVLYRNIFKKHSELLFLFVNNISLRLFHEECPYVLWRYFYSGWLVGDPSGDLQDLRRVIMYQYILVYVYYIHIIPDLQRATLQSKNHNLT